MVAEKYVLKYFNFRMIGEPIRWQFALAKVPFTDLRIPRDTWEAENKQKIGFGRLPVLVINDKIEITSAAAISRYLANKFGLLPENELLKARCDELVDNLQDLRMLYRPCVVEKDPAKKSELEKTMENTQFPFYLPRFEKFISTHGQNGYAVGNSLTYADFYLATFIQIWTETHGLELIKDFPLLKNHMEKILDIPEIKEWNSNRPVTKY